ncbi:ATP-binding protein [Roseomonas mucosa]|uniref:ATP-binding protein n=1 Tax=Roseomonas mucosa TaxID=207340 RepID=UPI003248B035
MEITVTNPAPIARIRGSLGPKVLSKSPELFNQSLPTVLAEVLQNARRAGASRVEIEHPGEGGRATLVVRDDGHGIEDMAGLVRFGASGWDERIEVAENAAGMGVFSLASRGVTVRSRGRRVTLTRAVFCGEEEAVALPDPEIATGTEMTFSITEAGVEKLIAQAARFYPLPVTLNGQPLTQGDFLDGAAHVIAWQGLRLGVFHEVPLAVRAVHDSHWGSDRRLYLNFHGHVVRCARPVTLAEEDGERWCVLVDVVNAPDLRLVLPARNEPIENNFFRAMRHRMERAILEAIAASGRHALAFADYRRAGELGIALPPPTITLPAWRPDSDECRSRLDAAPPVTLGREPGEVLVAPGPLHPGRHEEANLRAFLDAWPDHPVVVEGRNAFAGYPAYDALPRIVGMQAGITAMDGQLDHWPPAMADAAPGGDPIEADQVRVSGIEVRLLVRDPAGMQAGPKTRHALALPFLFTSEADTYDFPGVLAMAGTDPAALADALVAGFFTHNDDAGADSYERQVECYAADAHDLARRLLLTQTEARIARVIDGLREIGWLLRGFAGGRVEIAVPAGAPATLRLTAGDGTVREVPL